MLRSPKALIPEEPYVRAREDPFFNGLLRGDDAGSRERLIFDFQMNAGMRNISRSVSDIGNIRSKKLISDTSEKSMDLPEEDTVADIVLEPKGKSKSVMLSKTMSFPFPGSQMHLTFGDNVDVTEQSSLKNFEATEDYNLSPVLARPVIEKSYSISKCKLDLSKISLRQSAASFYNGFSPQVEIVESCESIERLNLYLNARRDDVNAGVPGKFLHAVVGQDVTDIGSVASTIMYAFYLNETLDTDQFCTVPVINMKRANLSSHAELIWLLDSSQIDKESLIFMDEIDLSYFDLFGSLKLVLINGNRLPTKKQALKEAVVEIFNCTKGESVYPWVETVTMGQDSSCCTLIAEKFALTTPELLAGRGFSRLLLAGILTDTGNLCNPHCTTKDKHMATLLIDGAGRFGSDGLYQILRYKMHDVSYLKVVDILHKDFKKWARVDGMSSRSMGSSIGMSTIGLSVEQLLTHDTTATEDISYFQRLEKLRLLMIVSGYYDSQKNFKMEILVSAESVEVMRSMLFFFESNTSQLSLTVLHQPGLREYMKAFEIDKLTSRRTIERLLEEFSGASQRVTCTAN